MFGSGPYPSRNISQNLADLMAQIAACETGARELLTAVRHYGADVVTAYMGHVQDNAEEAVRRATEHLSDGAFDYELDDGAFIRVMVAIDRVRRQVKVDFTGTSEQRPSNFNAPRSVCKAAVLYVFRTLIDESIPMNEGVLRPIDIVIPTGSMLSPVFAEIYSPEALSDPDDLDPRFLVQRRLITYSRHSRPHQDLTRYFEINGLSDARISCVNSVAAMIKLAQTGFGICVMPPALLPTSLTGTPLKIYRSKTMPPALPFVASWRAASEWPERLNAIADQTIEEYMARIAV